MAFCQRRVIHYASREPYQILQAQEAEIINVCVVVEAFDQVATQLSLIEGLIQPRCHILDVGGEIVHDLQK